MGKTKILIYDSISDGHHLDYLFYFIHQTSQRPNIELIVVCHQNITKNLADFNFPINQFTNISFHFLTNHQIQSFHSKNIFSRSLQEWKFALNIAKINQVQEIFFPYFDYFQFAVLFGEKPKAKISGILFSSIAQNKAYAHLKKEVIKSVVNKPFFQKLFILSEEYSKILLPISTKIQFLFDPIYTFPNNPAIKQSVQNKLNIPPNKTTFLNFGHLDERKGIQPFLEAIQLLSPQQRENIHLVLAGKLDPKIKPLVENLLSKVPEISTSLLFQHLDPEEIQYLFESTDWSLVLYPKFLGSSSVLVRSALAQKPILGNNYGNIAFLLEKYPIGLTANPENPTNIAQKLTEILLDKPKFSPEIFENFSKNHSLENFGNALLGPITQNT